MQTALKTVTVHIPAQNCLGYTAMNAHLKQIAEVAGGYNLCETYGGWVMADGELIHECVNVLTVHLFTAAAMVGIEPVIRRLVSDMLNEGNQEAVLADLGDGPTIYTLEDVQ